MRRFFASSLILLLAAGFTTPASAAETTPAPFGHLAWREIGPAASGGRVAAVAGTPQDPKLYYIGAAGGGVWKSANGGATWTPVFAKQPVAAIGAVAIDPTNENVVWVGTGEANPRNDVSYGDGVYKTVDGGKTWTNVGLQKTRHISRILVDPRNPNHVIVGALGDVFADSTERGVFVTDDGGKTWNKTLYVGPQSGASDLAMDVTHPDVVYAGIWQFRRQPWTFTSGGPDDGLYKSTDGGKTWAKLAGHGLPEGMTGRIGLAVAPSDGNRVYALIEAKGGILWRSDDAGATWQMTTDNTLVDQRPFYFTHIAVDPSDKNHVYAVSEMLSESKDGGKKFKEIADSVHVDYHAIWIAPNDAKRIIVGEDGGYAITLDQGENWSFSRNLAIGQIYHVGLSNENPYTVCVALQDNEAFCGPSNSLDMQGIRNDHWARVIGGDGMWAVPDPSNPGIVMTDLQNGNIAQYSRATKTNRFVVPYDDFSRNDFTLYKRKYRFNWDSPIAFAPWNPKVLWYGGNVVFQSTDRGLHWSPISPDLTRNIKAHQQPSGGPLALDVSGAETSDTILDIEGSPVAKGQIWVGTDDGNVQLTRDGGKHWKNVTPPGVPPFGRVETVAPSPFASGTAYTVIDRHRSGDYTPYVFVTHDYGATWTKIVEGLPADQYARTIRPDIRDVNLVYAGTEQGIWISYDSGAHWSTFQINLPTVSVRDIRPQAQFNDLAIATHGRGTWILDDMTPVQMLPAAKDAGVALFPIRTAFEYAYHQDQEEIYSFYAAKNPPRGAIVSFYQAKVQDQMPTIEILDSSGTVVRHIKNEGDRKPITNDPGINRVVWDLHEDGVTQWKGAGNEEFTGPHTGPLVLPGHYSARMTLGGKTFTQTFDVKPDPRSPYTQAQLASAYAFSKKYLGVYDRIDRTLNALDDQKKELTAAKTALDNKHPDLTAKVDAALAEHDAIFNTLTADYHNDEDSIQRPGGLREDIPSTGYGAPVPPTASTLEFAHRFDTEYDAAMARYDAYAKTLEPLAAELKAAGVKTSL